MRSTRPNLKKKKVIYRPHTTQTYEPMHDYEYHPSYVGFAPSTRSTLNSTFLLFFISIILIIY